MKQNISKLILTFVFILTSSVLIAEKNYKIYKVFSGSAAPIAMDLNADGIPAIRAIGGGPGSSMRFPFQFSFQSNSNPFAGEFSADNVSEGVLVEQPTGRCAVDELEFALIHYSSVTRYWNGDLLYSVLKEGFSCLNPFTGLGYGTVQIDHIGGTGRFEGVKGESVREFQGRALDPFGLRSVMTATETGNATLPY
jgi:hypothetical protein